MWRRIAGAVVLSAALALTTIGWAGAGEVAESDATTWQQFLDDRPDLLRTLAPPIVACFQRRDTTDGASPIFHGCLDWHSAVHGAYSHHELYWRTGDTSYFDLVQAQIAPNGASLIPAESVYQQTKVRTSENPYGFGWFLILAREREMSTGRTDFRDMANFAATEMRSWFQTRATNGDARTYILNTAHPNYSWSLINLAVWAKYTNDPTILTAVRDATTPLLDPQLDTDCAATKDTGDLTGFQPACLMRLAAVAVVQGAEARDWVSARLPEGFYVPPITAPRNCHAGGLNFYRAFALYQLYLVTGDTGYRDNYVDLIRYHTGRPDLYIGGAYSCYAHWVAQVGVRAISLSYEDPNWEQFLADRPGLLRTLAPPIVACFQRRDTSSPIFHGCLDWHSAVHGAYSHHSIYRRTGDPTYLDLVEQQIAPNGVSLIPAESQYQQNQVRTSENPYGFGWFLILAREREQSAGTADFREMANFAATEMRSWFQRRATNGDARTYILNTAHPNYSWSLINLAVWGKYTHDPTILAAVRDATTPLLDPQLDTDCPATQDRRNDLTGFQPACLMRLAAVAVSQGAAARDWVLARLPAGYYVPPVVAPRNCHAGGLNFYRAFALYQLYLVTGDTRYRDNYVELIRFHTSRPDIYAGGAYNCYAHWVAQVGVRAISLSYPQATALSYTGDTTQDYHDVAAFSVRLVDADDGDTPLAGRQVDFALGSQGCSATTDGDGVASCEITIAQPAGSYALTIIFGGDAASEPASLSVPFVVTPEETTISYTGETVLGNDGAATLAAVLNEDGVVPISGRTLTLMLGTGAGAQSCTGTTNAAGRAACTIASVAQPNGPGSASASFAGDVFYEPAADFAATLVYDFAPGGGAFVIGDGNAAVGSAVTFWGSQWAKLNTLSGGPAPSTFKGFAHTPARPACGTAWGGDKGGDSPPPAPLPAYIGVIATSSATLSATTPAVSGDTKHVVVVKTNPGYQPDPAFPGTGTVTATVC